MKKQLGLTRRCLELIDEYGFGLSIQTKSDLILRDLDVLKRINEKTKCVVSMTLTTWDEALCRVIEPNVCTTKRRFEVLKVLRDEGIPTIVWLTPMVKAECRRAGIVCGGERLFEYMRTFEDKQACEQLSLFD